MALTMMDITYLGIEARKKEGVRWADTTEFFFLALLGLIIAVMHCPFSKRQT